MLSTESRMQKWLSFNWVCDDEITKSNVFLSTVKLILFWLIGIILEKTDSVFSVCCQDTLVKLQKEVGSIAMVVQFRCCLRFWPHLQHPDKSGLHRMTILVQNCFLDVTIRERRHTLIKIEFSLPEESWVIFTEWEGDRLKHPYKRWGIVGGRHKYVETQKETQPCSKSETRKLPNEYNEICQ